MRLGRVRLAGRRATAAALAVAFALAPAALGCAPLAPSTAVVIVTIAPPAAGAVDPVVAPSAARPRAPALAHEADDAPATLAGSWRAPSTNTRFAIEVDDGHASVVDAVDDNAGEHFAITRTRFTRGVLSWSYRIPATGVVMSYESAGLDGDALRARWHNDAGGVGDEVLERWVTAADASGTP